MSLPQLIRESFTEEQKSALRIVLTENPLHGHSVYMRITLPIPYRPLYLTLV